MNLIHSGVCAYVGTLKSLSGGGLLPPIESKVGYKIVTGLLGLAFPTGKSSGSETHDFIYSLGFGTVGIRKKKMIQELLLSLNQAKNKIKVHHHIKVRKSSAFISMQRA
jgi:hypothetical protein